MAIAAQGAFGQVFEQVASLDVATFIYGVAAFAYANGGILLYFNALDAQSNAHENLKRLIKILLTGALLVQPLASDFTHSAIHLLIFEGLMIATIVFCVYSMSGLVGIAIVASATKLACTVSHWALIQLISL